MITSLFAALLLSSHLRAAAEPHDPAGRPAAGSDWVEDGARGENPGDPGSVNRDRFREEFQNNTLDNICRLARLSAGLKLNAGGFVGIQIGARRSLRRYADGKLALIEEAPVRFSLNYSQDLLKLSDKVTTGAFFSAGFDGQSTVILPLEDSSCKALRILLNPLKFKSVVPVSGFKDLVTRADFTQRMAARIMAMRVNEVWKLPVKPSVGWGPNITVPVGPASFNAHWTFTTTRGESVSLKRLSPSEVRYRFRIDSVKVDAKGVGANAAVTTADLGIDGKFVYSQLISLFNQYFRANIGVNEASAKGREVILEYILNPNDPDQMKALVRAVSGDIGVLDTIKQMAKRTDRLLATDENIRQGLERLKEEHDEALSSEATFAAGNVYRRPSRNFHIHLPFLFRMNESSSDAGQERIVLIDEKGGEIHLYPATSHVSRGFAEIPILGDLDRYEKSLGVQVYTYKDINGHHDTANAVFIEQRAFTREGPWTPNGMLEGVNGVMRYAGTRGLGVDSRKELPLPPFKTTVIPPVGPRGTPGVQGYEKGMSAFTLILSRKAIADILQTAPEAIARAYTNALSEAEKAVFHRGLAGTLTAGATTRENRHDKERAQAKFAAMTRAIAGIVADIREAREAGDPESQARAVRDILAGAGRSGEAYADILKVLIQFVDPADAAAIVDIDVKAGGNEPGVRKRFVLNPGGADSDLVRAYAAARARFIAPSTTSD